MKRSRAAIGNHVSMFTPPYVNKPHHLRTSKFCARVAIRLFNSRRSREFGWLHQEIVEMGPLYVKLGQVLSSRTDILPQDVATVLKGLQSDVPAESFDTVQAIFREDFGTDISNVFETFEESPFAAASIGQVHRAVILPPEGGAPVCVAVKVQRPNIRDDFEKEISILKQIMDGISVFGARAVDESITVLNDMERSIREETDFEIELKNMQKFRDVLSDTNIVIVPRAISSLSSPRVLTMEYIPSNKVTDYRSETIATGLMRAFVTAVIERGYVHCDPHPGNIGVTDEHQIVLYDYGMVSKLRPDMKSYLRRICMAVFNRNTDTLGNLLLESKFVRTTRSDSNSVRDMNSEEYVTMHRLARHVYEYMDSLDVNLLSERIKSDDMIDADNLPFKLDTNLFFLFRSFSILEGVCKEVDPDFNYTTLMTQLFMDLIDITAIIEKGQSDMQSAFNSVSEDDEDKRVTLMRIERMDKQITTKKRDNDVMIVLFAFIYVLMNL